MSLPSVTISIDEASGPAVGQVLVLPGANYSVELPGLFWPCTALISAGWRAVVARWAWNEDAAAEPHRIVDLALERLSLHRGADLPTMIMGKSIGTLATSFAAQERLPGIWLTPLLHTGEAHRSLVPAAQDVAAALRESPRSLLVGGTADPSWAVTPDLRDRHVILEVADMNHGFEVTGDWRRSLSALQQICQAVEDYAQSVAR